MNGKTTVYSVALSVLKQSYLIQLSYHQTHGGCMKNLLVMLLLFAGLLNPVFSQPLQKNGQTSTTISYYYHLTTGSYLENADMEAVCVSEFGVGASLADWANVKNWISGLPDGMTSFYAASGMLVAGICYLQWNGVRYASGGRHYFIQQFNSGAPGGFLVHDSYLSLYLGSWYGMVIQVMAQVPEATVPVNMSSFKAFRTSEGVRLLWTTETERNNSGFSLTRSVNNSVFEDLTFIAGQGTTTDKHFYSYFDMMDGITPSEKVSYRMYQVDFDGKVTFAGMTEAGYSDENTYILSPNYPNPFNPVTTIKFSIPQKGMVTLSVFDLMGREVKTLISSEQNAGFHTIVLNGSDLSSGSYFIRLSFGGKSVVRQVVLMK